MKTTQSYLYVVPDHQRESYVLHFSDALFAQSSVSITCKVGLESSFELVLFVYHGMDLSVRSNQMQEHSNVSIKIIYAVASQDQLYISTTQDHAASHTASSLVVGGLASGRAKCIYKGLIVIARDALQVDANQQNKNLLLSNHASVFAQPTIEVLCDDVQCSHGSATSWIDEQALYFLQARGLNEQVAYNVLLNAFFRQIDAREKFKVAYNTLKNKALHDSES